MSYYQGDFYSGDPGFFGTLGKIGKGLLGIGSAVVPGVGLAGRAAGVLEKVAGSRVGQMVVKHPTLSAAGAAGTIGALGGTGMGRMTSRMGAAGVGPTMLRTNGGGMLRGFHMSKPHKGVLPHLVRNRRMRVTNPRALRRAIRRAKGFERLARKVMHFVSPRKTKGRAIFRVRRRAK